MKKHTTTRVFLTLIVSLPCAIFSLGNSVEAESPENGSAHLSDREVAQAIIDQLDSTRRSLADDFNCIPMAGTSGTQSENWTPLRKADSKHPDHESDRRGPCKQVVIKCIPADGWPASSTGALCRSTECTVLIKSEMCSRLGYHYGDVIDVEQEIDRLMHLDPTIPLTEKSLTITLNACSSVHELCHAQQDHRTMSDCESESECYNVETRCLDSYLRRLCDERFTNSECIALKVNQCAKFAFGALNRCRCDNQVPPNTPCPSCAGLCTHALRECIYAIVPPGDPRWNDPYFKDLPEINCKKSARVYCARELLD